MFRELPPLVLLIGLIVLLIGIILLAIWFARRLASVARRQTRLLTDAEFEHSNEFLDQFVLLIHEALPYDQFGIGLADAEGRIVYRAGYGLPEEWKTQCGQAPGEGIVGHVFQAELKDTLKNARSITPLGTIRKSL